MIFSERYPTRSYLRITGCCSKIASGLRVMGRALTYPPIRWLPPFLDTMSAYQNALRGDSGWLLNVPMHAANELLPSTVCSSLPAPQDVYPHNRWAGLGYPHLLELSRWKPFMKDGRICAIIQPSSDSRRGCTRQTTTCRMHRHRTELVFLTALRQTVPPHPPRVPTMISRSQQTKRRDAALTALDGSTLTLSAAKDTCDVPLAKIALASACILLTTIKAGSRLFLDDELLTHDCSGQDGQEI